MTDANFQAYSRAIRDKVNAGAHEPVCSPGLNRYRVKSITTIPLARGQASKRNEQECKESAKTFMASSSALGEGVDITILESGLHSGNQKNGQDEQTVGSILESAPAGEETSAVLDIEVSPPRYLG
ncbi:hypothetical protein SI65_07606 [Aspergillus cristatus]|uniref:Uncharacterized protein n=1 Tax=Aspergillus cristatus TaxID=573508 RepID=A0A1E3B8D7_ASPCR|nr:hypothetical protein SI65_07606 [Aspergillus cristatus]